MACKHEEAFLADICEHPEDDAPRLIYADWLEDAGKAARAEFIRIQIERARLSGTHPRQRDLASRESQLLQANEREWREELPRLTGVGWEEFTRGFIEAAFVESAGTYLRYEGHLLSSTPLSRLQIGEIDAAGARQLVRSRGLGRLSELNLGNNPTLGRGLRELAGAEQLTNLTGLLLHYNSLGEEVTVLAESPYLGNLKELYLSGNQLTDATVATLARSLTMPRLEQLDLRDNLVGDGGVRALAYHGQREALTTLLLVNNEIGPAGAWALAGTPYLPNLTRLYLNYNPLEDDGANAFASSPHRKALRELDLRHSAIRQHGGLALAGSPHLDNLEQLWLGGNRLGGEVLALLRRQFGTRLRM